MRNISIEPTDDELISLRTRNKPDKLDKPDKPLKQRRRRPPEEHPEEQPASDSTPDNVPDRAQENQYYKRLYFKHLHFKHRYYKLKAEEAFVIPKIFYTGRNRLVFAHYSLGMAVYQSIKQAAIQCAKETNKGKSTYLISYETTALRLANLFGISHESALKVIKFLNDAGAWEQIKIKPGKIYVYKIGERIKRSYPEDGRWKKRYLNTFVFNLTGNKKTKSFYRSERKRLFEKQKGKVEQKKENKSHAKETKALNMKINKVLCKIHGNDNDAAQDHFDDLAELYRTSEMNEALAFIYHDLREELKEINYEKYEKYQI
ncbi:MAG: hypothetical protein U9Q34_05575 [Elusimicrobiota bacterium]|nr:hypothetical protein [Elusimicrobiota bacterium]